MIGWSGCGRICIDCIMISVGRPVMLIHTLLLPCLQLSNSRTSGVATDIATDAFSTIPTHLISYATLEFVGFTPQEAASMWAMWRTRYSQEVPENKRDFDILSKAFRHFLHIRLFEERTGLLNCYVEDAEAWQACMETYGINAELQREILSPQSVMLRTRCPWDYSCLAWVKDEIYGRFCSLQHVRLESQSRTQFAIETAEEELERQRDNFSAILAQLRPETAPKVDEPSETPSSSL